MSSSDDVRAHVDKIRQRQFWGNFADMLNVGMIQHFLQYYHYKSVSENIEFLQALLPYVQAYFKSNISLPRYTNNDIVFCDVLCIWIASYIMHFDEYVISGYRSHMSEYRKTDEPSDDQIQQWLIAMSNKGAHDFQNRQQNWVGACYDLATFTALGDKDEVELIIQLVLQKVISYENKKRRALQEHEMSEGKGDGESEEGKNSKQSEIDEKDGEVGETTASDSSQGEYNYFKNQEMKDCVEENNQIMAASVTLPYVEANVSFHGGSNDIHTTTTHGPIIFSVLEPEDSPLPGSSLVYVSPNSVFATAYDDNTHEPTWCKNLYASLGERKHGNNKWDSLDSIFDTEDSIETSTGDEEGASNDRNSPIKSSRKRIPEVKTRHHTNGSSDQSSNPSQNGVAKTTTEDLTNQSDYGPPTHVDTIGYSNEFLDEDLMHGMSQWSSKPNPYTDAMTTTEDLTNQLGPVLKTRDTTNGSVKWPSIMSPVHEDGNKTENDYQTRQLEEAERQLTSENNEIERRRAAVNHLISQAQAKKLELAAHHVNIEALVLEIDTKLNRVKEEESRHLHTLNKLINEHTVLTTARLREVQANQTSEMPTHVRIQQRNPSPKSTPSQQPSRPPSIPPSPAPPPPPPPPPPQAVASSSTTTTRKTAPSTPSDGLDLSAINTGRTALKQTGISLSSNTTERNTAPRPSTSVVDANTVIA